jgi:protein involved in polysaccharide export with SLBB domain
MPGDMVTIFSTADLRVPSSQQTRFVRLEGEFVGAGVYSVLPGETLRQLLTRAGGFTPDAYLYASEFTRQSTKRVEQQRLREYADQLEAQVAVETQGLAQRAVSDRDQAAAAAAGSSARLAVERLRQIEPEGRIVLQLKPDSRTVNEVPDLALEDGDRFVVPRTPSSVNVEGQVYSANAFVFERGRTVKDYLKIAGGPSRDADSGRAFVLRADGSVYSEQYGNLKKATMFPGDTIVVPMKIAQKALLRNLVDIATIAGQFGLAIAAINVLK